MPDKLSRSGSFSSVGSGVSSAVSDSSTAKLGGEGLNASAANDLLEQNQTFQAAIFGVLYTLAKEKYDTSKKFAFARLVLDFLQCFVLIIQPTFGWHVNEGNFIWKAMTWLQFSNPITSRGYNFYTAILYILTACLGISVLLCIWVGWCFKNDRFPYIWPIKMLRFIVATFFVMLYIASLAIFLVAYNCNWFVSDPTIKHKVHAFPDTECLKMPHLGNMAVSIACTLIFIFISFAMTVADFEMNPVSRRWYGCPHTRVEVWALFVKTVMTVTVPILYSQTKIQAVLLFSCSGYLFYSFVRWEPHYMQWVNHARSGLYCMVAWAALMLLVLAYGDPDPIDEEDFSKKMTNIMLFGLAPLFFVGVAASYVRLRWRRVHAMKSFTHIGDKVMRLKDVYRFPDPYEVEIVARVARKWTPDDDEVLDADAIKLAENVYKIGLAHFHDSVYMIICYSNFQIEVQGNYQSGTTQLQHAKKLSPGLSDRFLMFCREQEHKQRAQSSSSGESATDLISYVEFQRNYRVLLRAHKQSLTATRNFWKQLLHRDVAFASLAKSFRIIEANKTRADRTYKMVLDRYPTSVKLLRSYGRFLEEVKNDPWTAAKYFVEADKVEEQQENAANESMLSEGDEQAGMMANVDEKNNAVAVINASGIIQMANKVLMKMFGYKKGELEGKNVSLLMPAPFNQRHNSYLRNYITTGKAKILDSVREVVGLHKEHYVFPVKIAVSKVSGTGADSVFMGVLKPTDDDPHTIKAWVMPQGMVLCVDMRFPDWFGKSPQECVGRQFSTLALEQDQLLKLIDMAAQASERDFLVGKVRVDNVHVLHKFSEPVEVNMSVELGGTEGQRLLVVSMKRPHPVINNMMVTDAKGRIMYMNNDLAGMLGLTPKAALKMEMSKLLPPPYAQLHHKWMKEPNPRIPLQGCRAAATVVMWDSKSQGHPVKPHITTREDGDTVIHIVNVEASSFERGLDERRLALIIDAQGFVQTVGESPMSVFGFKPSTLVGLPLWRFIDVFKSLKEETSELVGQMLAKVTDKPGFSWRVGVHPPFEEAQASNSAVAMALLAKNTKPAIMQIELKTQDIDGETDVPIINLYLWKADMVTGVLELDREGHINKAACCPLHSGGLVFGYGERAMIKQHVNHFVQMPSSAGTDWLMLDDKAKTKGALKAGTATKKIGPQRNLEGYHSDGSQLQIKIICVAKENTRRFAIKVNFTNYTRGDPDLFKATLTGDTADRVRDEARLRAQQRFREREQASSAKGNKSRKGITFAGDADEEDDALLDTKLAAVRSSAAQMEASYEPPQAAAALEPLDGDDAGSQMSSQEGGGRAASVVSGSEAGGYQSDFKRGKRFKKLAKLLSSKQAKADLDRYRLHSYGILGALLVVHTVCFVIFLTFLNNQSELVKEVAGCGDVSYHAQRVAVAARMLYNLYRNQTNATWYSWDDLDSIIENLRFDIGEMETWHQGLYLGFAKLRHLGEQYDLDLIWEGKDLNESLWIDTRASHIQASQSSLWLMGNQFIASARELASNHPAIANATGNMLNYSRDWQYVINNGPWDIAAGYRYSMDSMVLRTWDSVGKLNTMGIILLVMEGCVACIAACLYSWVLLQAVARQRFALFSVFLVIPTAFLRALASKHVQVDGDDDDDSDDDELMDMHQQQQQQSGPHTGPPEPIVGAVRTNIKQVVVDVDLGPASVPRPWYQRLNPATWLSDNTGLDMGKKRLLRDSRDTLKLATPFMLWGCLVIAIYCYSYFTLTTVVAPLVNLDVSNRVKVKMSRVIFRAHELISQDNDESKDVMKNQLEIRQDDLHVMYDALLYGSSNLPEMAFSETDGSLFADSQVAEAFFREKDVCYLTEFKDRFCYGDGDEYYMVSNNALDPMVRRLLEEAKLLSHDSYANINFNSSRFDYIWRVAYYQLQEGVVAAADFYTASLTKLFNNVRIAHVVLFALSWLLAIFFVFFLFKPFIKRASTETRQVAEMMSQLPPEMDVEGLVVQAMTRHRPNDEEDDNEMITSRKPVEGGGKGSSVDLPRVSSQSKQNTATAKGDDDGASVASSL